MSALHGLAGQGWVTDTPRMNPVQWRGMPSTCRAVPAANVDRRSRDGQQFRRTLKATSGFVSRPCAPLSSAGRAEPPRSASCYPSGPGRSSVGRRGARRPLGRVGELCRGLRRHTCAARRKKTCCIAFGASPPTPRDACTTRGSQTHRAARSRSTTSTPASLLVDRPDAQDLTSRALARSWPSHVCALADEPELGGFELIAAVPEQRPPSPPLEVPAAP